MDSTEPNHCGWVGGWGISPVQHLTEPTFWAAVVAVAAECSVIVMITHCYQYNTTGT